MLPISNTMTGNVSQVIGFPIFFVCNSLLLYACKRITIYLSKPVHWIDTVIDTVILYLTTVIVLQEVAGSFGLLRQWILVPGICFGSILIILFSKPPISSRVMKPKLITLTKNQFPLIIGFIFIGLALLEMIYGTRYVGPEGWDVFTYHLGFPAEWLSSGALRNPLQHYGDFAPPFYPLNSSLLASWFMILMNSDAGVRFVQLLFALGGALALHRVAELMGIPRIAALLAPLSFLLTPMTLGYSLLTFCDLSLTGAFIMALMQLFLLSECPKNSRAFISGCAMGIFLGVKYSSVPFSIPLWILFLILLLGMPRKATIFLLFMGGVSLAGGYTYFRNWIITGNPLFPAYLQIFGHTIFDGWVDTRFLSHADFQFLSFVDTFFTRKGLIDLGYHIPLLLFVIVPLAFLITLFQQKKQRVTSKSLSILVVLLMPIILFSLYYFALPYRNDARFFFPTIPVTCLALACLTASARLPVWIVSIVLLGFVSITDYYFLHQYILLSISLALSCLLYVVSKKTSGIRIPDFFWNKQVYWFIWIVFLIVVSTIAYPFMKEYNKNKWDRVPEAYGDMIRWVNENMEEYTFRIAYTGFNAPYPLFGSHFQHKVFYVPHHPPVEAYYGFGYPAPVPLYSGDQKQWRQNLDALAPDILVTSKHNNLLFPIEDQWAQQEHFPLIYNDTVNHIFAISQSARGSFAAE